MGQDGGTWMRRRTGFIIALVVVCLGGMVILTALPGPSYSATQVLAGLRRQPTAWLGHPIRVRGVLYLCPPTGDCGILGSLADKPISTEPTSTQRLFLADTIESPALRELRKVPLLNLLLPPYPPRAQGRRGTYTITIYRLPAPSCPYTHPVILGQPYCIVLSDTPGL